jgi:signal transduction histidine kinase/ligand-binding sensor domain-containing protein
MSPRLVSGLLLCALLAPPVAAQLGLPPSISHSSWTDTDGLPQNSVLGISQDSTGYLWVTTFGGLARFDGRHFQVFDVLSRPDLPENRFLNVIHGRDESMWIWAQESGLFRYRGDRFTHLETPAGLKQLVEDAEGCLWATFKKELVRISEDRVDVVREGEFLTVFVAEDGTIWVATLEGELLRLEDGQETVFGLDAGLPPRDAMQVLLEDDDGILWGGCSRGVWRSTDATRTEFERVEGAPIGVRGMALDERGGVWVSSRDRLVRFDLATGNTVEVARGNFRRFFEDARGNLWVGSLGQGLHCLRYAALQDVNTALGLPAENSWAITEDSSGTIFILFDRALWEVRDGEVTHTNLNDNLKSVLIDREGDLWIGMGGGLLRIRGDHESAYGEDDGLSGPVRALLEDRDGTLWIGTATGLFRREGDRFVPFLPEQLVGIRCLLRDETSKALWVGTQTGLARTDGGSLTWLTAKDGLSPGVVRALHLDSDGVLWVGSYGGGLSRIENDTIVRYSRNNGLADNYVSCILEDDDGRLWINSNRGPFVVHRSELNRVASGEADRIACTSFTRGEGAREANGGSQPAGWRTADGRMWFPSIEGVTVADPKELPLDEAPPNVLIESFEIDEKRELDVRFTALGFSSPERVRIQTRLAGHHPSWIEDEGERRAHYSYLPPGDYEFQVRARNGYGPWSQVVRERFEVEFRFHETTIFLVGIALLGALGALALTEFRLKRSRARTAELVQLVEERERAERSLSKSQAELRHLSRELLVNQETERRRISRELHDDLGQRLAALAIQADVAKRRLGEGIDQTHDQLYDIVEMTRQLSIDVQQLSRRLHPVGLRTLGLTEAVRQECDAFTRRGGVNIELEVSVASEEISEDVAVAAFRILQESLHNIEKHARANAVKIRVVMEDGELVVSVSDRGQGFDIENGTDAGLGLVTMRERAASIGGELSVTSRPGGGTTVCLRAPERRKRE